LTLSLSRQSGSSVPSACLVLAATPWPLSVSLLLHTWYGTEREWQPSYAFGNLLHTLGSVPPPLRARTNTSLFLLPFCHGNTTCNISEFANFSYAILCYLSAMATRARLGAQHLHTCVRAPVHGAPGNVADLVCAALRLHSRCSEDLLVHVQLTDAPCPHHRRHKPDFVAGSCMLSVPTHRNRCFVISQLSMIQ